MSNTPYYVQDTDLTAVANAIRARGGLVGAMVFPNEFVAHINSLRTYLNFATPLATDIMEHWVSSQSTTPGTTATWNYESGNLAVMNDIYAVIPGHSYVVGYGATAGARFSAILTTYDPATTTTNKQGYLCFRSTSAAYKALFVEVPSTGGYQYLAVYKTQDGTTGIPTYVIDVTDLLQDPPTPPTLPTITDLSYMFNNGARISGLDDFLAMCGQITDLQYAFNNCNSSNSVPQISNLDLSSLDFSEVKSALYAFQRANSILSVTWPQDIDLRKCTTLAGMFYQLSSITDWSFVNHIRISNLCTSIADMFNGAGSNSSQTVDIDLSGWDTSNVTNFSNFMSNFKGVKNLNVSGWDISKLNMNYLYSTPFTVSGGSLNVSNWVLGNLQGLNYMFYTFNGNIIGLETWQPTNVYSFGSLFMNVRNLTVIDLSTWESTSQTARNLGQMFYNAMNTEKIAIGKICGASVSNSQNIFAGTSSLTELVILDDVNLLTITNSNAFNNSRISAGRCTIYVPDTMLTSYQTASNWVTYASQIKPLSEYPGTPWWAAAQS